jgi:hypothetical protein
MNRLSIQERVKILSCLVEGNSIRATARITDTDKKTVLRLLAELGEVCLRLHDERVRNVNAKRVQCDEIWSFVGSKQKNTRPDQSAERGDIWTWVAIDAETKLVASWLVGKRNTANGRSVHRRSGRTASLTAFNSRQTASSRIALPLRKVSALKLIMPSS